MKSTIKVLQYFLPKTVAKMAYKAMNNPSIKKLRESEEEILNKSLMRKVKYENFEIQEYQWEKKHHKTALLVHGWEGQAGNFAGLIDVLTNKGYHVVAFDAPSHGRSSVGKTSMFKFGEFLEAQFLKFKPSLVISHSFGSVTTATVLRKNPNINLDLWIMVTTPYQFMERVNDISRKVGINEKTKNELVRLITKSVNEKKDELDMAIVCQQLSTVKKAVIVHSKTDKILSIEGSRVVVNSFEDGTLIELDNLGHYSILWSKELSEIVSQVS
jgi:predicted alpha/beta-fold hydrolase